VFSCSNLRFDRLVSAYVPTYAYEFSDPKALFSLGAFGLLLPKMDLGAYHGAEIAYVFRTSMGLGDPEDFTPGQDDLSKQMVAYWVNFARTGDPNGGDLPAWKPFKDEGKIQSFAPDAIQAVANFADEHQCPFWFAMGR
jgi:para-nitrobenzyl esterase